jgi:hypothetical protein
MIMQRQFGLIVTMIFFIKIVVHSQTTQLHQLPETITSNSTHVFQKIERVVAINKKDSVDFYPLHIGDFWEYIEADTVMFMGENRSSRYSLAKEVTGDSVIGNYSYKKIVAQVCANSIQRADSCELQRIDSTGNVYYFFDGKDQLRYDFSKGIGERFASPYPDRYWEVGDKYTVVGFGDTLQAIDFYLYNKDRWYERTETVIEKFGLTYYCGSAYTYDERPWGKFFGGILNGITYGNLLVKKQKVDWSEFYPLHIGDVWKYEGHEGVFEIITIKSVISDTLMPDNNIYKVIVSQSFGGPYSGKGTVFERFDNTVQSVMSWNSFGSTSLRKIKFSVCLGDTFASGNSSFNYVFDDKTYDEIQYSIYPDLVNATYNFARGMGLTSETGEFYYSGLVGAVINGIVYGDTTVTNITEKENKIPTEVKLYPNYPNPFNPSTVISYQLPAKSIVTLKVFDVMGSEVAILANEEKDAGNYQVVFDAKKLASGIYFYTLRAKNFTSTQKMILIK